MATSVNLIANRSNTARLKSRCRKDPAVSFKTLRGCVIRLRSKTLTSEGILDRLKTWKIKYTEVG